mmetsp:Transcript_18152/g.68667  ORF Transcript_18152/g.68667 Transcript_18152/m.68667 type:complete len:299 (-) Transcript_18152:3823-4719(-)
MSCRKSGRGGVAKWLQFGSWCSTSTEPSWAVAAPPCRRQARPRRPWSDQPPSAAPRPRQAPTPRLPRRRCATRKDPRRGLRPAPGPGPLPGCGARPPRLCESRSPGPSREDRPWNGSSRPCWRRQPTTAAARRWTTPRCGRRSGRWRLSVYSRWPCRLCQAPAGTAPCRPLARASLPKPRGSGTEQRQSCGPSAGSRLSASSRRRPCREWRRRRRRWRRRAQPLALHACLPLASLGSSRRRKSPWLPSPSDARRSSTPRQAGPPAEPPSQQPSARCSAAGGRAWSGTACPPCARRGEE